MVEAGGHDPPSHGLKGRFSAHLSYASKTWCAVRELNPVLRIKSPLHRRQCLQRMVLLLGFDPRPSGL